MKKGVKDLVKKVPIIISSDTAARGISYRISGQDRMVAKVF